MNSRRFVSILTMPTIVHVPVDLLVSDVCKVSLFVQNKNTKLDSSENCLIWYCCS